MALNIIATLTILFGMAFFMNGIMTLGSNYTDKNPLADLYSAIYIVGGSLVMAAGFVIAGLSSLIFHVDIVSSRLKSSSQRDIEQEIVAAESQFRSEKTKASGPVPVSPPRPSGPVPVSPPNPRGGDNK